MSSAEKEESALDWDDETFSQEPVVLVRNSLPEDEKLDREMAELCQTLLAEQQ